MPRTNRLIQETSPYLRQHAHHPVDWIPWTEKAFEEAKKSNKLVIISIGYSACHWCHVMAHECFEDEEVADLMNAHFINIKVDREERPDIDHVYMAAVQLMTNRGGWPLNCITLPDGRPIYGGTYFPKEQWLHILKSLVYTFQNDYERVEEYAVKLHEGLSLNELIVLPESKENIQSEKLIELVARWKKQFDWQEGGMNRAPKFPLPTNYVYLLRHSKVFKDQQLRKFVKLTLDKLASGGIYDQLGSGFMRYSVDMIWKVPHFEKMLYDNAQLIELYALAYSEFKDEAYKEIIADLYAWLRREMRHEQGSFFSAMDADSEGEEGKYYCWEEAELKSLLNESFPVFADYYSISNRALWEDKKNILLRTQTDEEFLKKWKLSPSLFAQKKQDWKSILLAHRNKRIQPGIDYKCLTSWNALLITGLCQAYNTFHLEEYILEARQIGNWIRGKQIKANGKLFHVNTNEIPCVDGFLEDYAHTIDAFIHLYQRTGEIIWLEEAHRLTKMVEIDFMHPESKMCFFTSVDSKLIVRKMEIHDHVIPSSNSVMARNFLRLGHYYRHENWLEIARQMLANVYDGMETYGSGYSNWAQLLLELNEGFIEIHMIEVEVKERTVWPPNCLLSYHKELPISANYTSGIFVCEKGICHPAVPNLSAAKQLFEKD